MSEVSNRRFVHFEGTKQEFIDGGYPDIYQESIVFINADGDNNSNTIYTHGEYYGQGGVIIKGSAKNSAVLKDSSNSATGTYSMALGFGCEAAASGAHAEGYCTHATAGTSHSEGYETYATGAYSHAEGFMTEATHEGAHAEGYMTDAKSQYGHTEGVLSITTASGAHAEGGYITGDQYVKGGTSSGLGAHAEGENTTASGKSSHAEGNSTTASAWSSHAEGKSTKSSNVASHSEGESTEAKGRGAHAEGYATKANSNFSHTEGYGCVTNGSAVTVISDASAGTGYYAHAEGNGCLSIGMASHSEGYLTKAIGVASHAEGSNTTASGSYSHAEGSDDTVADGYASHAEGASTTASGSYSHAEGYDTTASGPYSHAEGNHTTASASYSHAEGYDTTASGSYSHAGGCSSQAVAEGSFSHGWYLTTSKKYEFACGKYNNSKSVIFSVGIGTSNDDRRNVFEIKYDGNNINANANFNVTGNAVVDTDLTVKGNTKLGNNASSDTTTIVGQVTLDGVLYANKDIYVGKENTSDRVLKIYGGLTTTRNVEVNGSLVTSGTIMGPGYEINTLKYCNGSGVSEIGSTDNHKIYTISANTITQPINVTGEVYDVTFNLLGGTTNIKNEQIIRISFDGLTTSVAQTFYINFKYSDGSPMYCDESICASVSFSDDKTLEMEIDNDSAYYINRNYEGYYEFNMLNGSLLVTKIGKLIS